MPYTKLKKESYTNISGINQKTSAYVTGDKEFLDIENFDFQTPGALGKRIGFTAGYLSSASFSIGASQTINSIWQVTSPSQIPDFIPNGLLTLSLFGYDSGVAAISGTLGATLKNWVTSITTSPTPYVWDHSEFIDSTYYSNSVSGYKNKATHTQAYIFGMAIANRLAVGGNGSGLTVTATTAGASFTGTFCYQYAFLDSMGFVGTPSATFIYSTAGVNTLTISGFTTSAYGSTSALAYGATAYILFRNRVPGFPTSDLISIGTLAIGATTFTDSISPTSTNQYFGFPFSEITALDYTKTWNVSEMFANRLWIDAGLNTIAFSELEQPQEFIAENQRIIASNNYRITGLKAYNQSLIILCQKGIFRLTGDNPDNFSVVEMSREYGCVSDKAIVIFNEKMWFLDDSAIFEFNGANFTNVGNRIQGYIDRLNKPNVYRRACAIHHPERNEIWFSLPIDGSDINNVTLVYDYLVDGWTTFKGTKLKQTAMGILYDNNVNANSYAPSIKKYYFGSIGGSMYLWGSSFKSDDGSGITLSFTTKYHNELGKSQTAQFRRLYLDVGGYTGPTLTFGVQMFANYATLTASATASMNFNQFQDRIDFGVPAKSLSFKVAHGSTTGDLKIGGYSVEYRFQRSV